MMDRVIAMLEREVEAKRELILNGTITSYEQYRTALAEYKTFLSAIEIARNAEVTEDELDDDDNYTELVLEDTA